MRSTYKNKRDQYQAEAQQERRAKEIAQHELEELKKKCVAKKEGLSCIVYCAHCQLVYSAIVPNGQTVHHSGCAHCGVPDQGYLVRKVLANCI